MPISQYNRYFGGQRGSAQEALDAMKRTYGPKDGERVFYAKIAKLKRKDRTRRGRR